HLVPEADHRLGSIVFVPQHAQAGRPEHEEPSRPRFEPEPARGKHSEKMTARKEQRVACDSPYPAYHPVGSSPDLVRRLAARAAITEQIPVRTLGMDLGTGAAFVCAVVPLHHVGFDDGVRAEAGQLARSARALQGAREYRGELQSVEPRGEPAGLGLALCRQWEVSSSGVLTRDRPGGLAVPRQVGERQRVAHGRLLVAAIAWRNGTLQPNASGITLPSVSSTSTKADFLRPRG